MPPTKPVEGQLTFDYQLNEDEMSDTSKRLAKSVQELAHLKLAKTEQAAHYASLIKEQEIELGRLTGIVITGKERRTVSCLICYNDPEPGKKSGYDIQTAALLTEQFMTAEERQLHLPFGKSQP